MAQLKQKNYPYTHGPLLVRVLKSTHVEVTHKIYEGSLNINIFVFPSRSFYELLQSNHMHFEDSKVGPE